MSKGFTLIEVLIASLLLCIFAGSFAFLVTSGMKQVKASSQLTRSILLCKSVMEDLRSKPFGNLFSYNNVSFDNGAGSIRIAAVGPDLISITIKHKVEINSMRSRY